MNRRYSCKKFSSVKIYQKSIEVKMKFLLILITFFLKSSESARILGVFPHPAISHQCVFHALMKDLAARGHHLTILTTDVNKQLKDNSNVTQIDLHDTYDFFRSKINFVEHKKSEKTEINLVESYYDVSLKFYDLHFNKPEVTQLINGNYGQKFDLMIFQYMSFWPYLALAEIYDVPVIGISSFDTLNFNHEWMGNAANAVVNPDILLPFEHGKLSFTERWYSLKYQFQLNFLLEPKQVKRCDRVVKKYFPAVNKTVEQMKERIQLVMTNTDPNLGYIRPLLPNTIQLGFLHIEPPKKLPAGELKTFLDKSKNGVIYMSLGSNVQSKDLGVENLQKFLQVFASLDYDVLWKFEGDNLPHKPDNVMISKWFPQSDLLAHPSIKVFITQGGQQSMEESIDRIVPMIVIPFLADQIMNSKTVENKGIGKRLELDGLKVSELTDTIKEVMRPEYKENIVKLRELIYDQPMTSRERAVWYTEYVIRHKGAKHLEYPGRLVPFYQIYCLDFIGIAVFTLAVSAKVLKMVFRMLSPALKAKKD